MQTGQKVSSDTQYVSIENYLKIEKENRQLQADNLYLQQELAQLKKMIFGSKAERYIPNNENQLSLDFDVEQIEQPEPETEEIAYKRKKNPKQKNSPVRMPLPSHLHREEILIEPAENIEGAKKIGEEITEILEYTPGKIYVEKYVRPKYTLPKQEEKKSAEETKIVIGQLPSFPIPKGNAGAGLLAHLLISKFVDHLPFYRQVQQFKRQDITIAESTISGWFSASCRLLMPLYEKLKEKIQQGNYTMADETPIKVLTSAKPGSTHKGYHWVYYSPLINLVCFDYQKGRGREGPENFFKEYTGTIQADGYNAYDIYDNKANITLLACLAHVRRKFFEAKDNDIQRAEYALDKIQALYKLEERVREEGFDYDKIKELRQKEALPILEEMEQWFIKQLPEVLPKSKIGKAINYAVGLWHRIKRYTEDGKYKIDNNLIENSIRPVALGRKNYLFAGSHDGAKYAAMMYSFLGTCKLNGIEPYKWLKDTLNNISDCSIKNIDSLLPIKPTQEK